MIAGAGADMAGPPVLLDLQCASTAADLPDEARLVTWIGAALAALDERGAVELTVRLVDEDEGAALNEQFRGKTGPTNVLSFPFEPPPGWPAPGPDEPRLLGDLILCAPVVAEEALAQSKPLDAHYAHLTVHGVLHLCGYDHLVPAEAEAMEALETRIVVGLGFPPPYENPHSPNDQRPI